jgi:hypothetical protein
MSAIRRAVIGFVLVVISAGCASANTFEGDLHVQATLAERDLSVSWSASLPESATLELEVFHPSAYASYLPSNDPNGFSYDVKRTLDSAGPKTVDFDLTQWPPGQVQVSLTFRPEDQPPSVVVIVGAKGERLSGEKREVDSDGMSFLREVVYVTVE